MKSDKGDLRGLRDEPVTIAYLSRIVAELQGYKTNYGETGKHPESIAKVISKHARDLLRQELSETPSKLLIR